MAGRRSIGELVAVISADAEHFNKTVTDSEKRLTAFAKRATAPVHFGVEGIAGLTSAIGAPMMAAMRPISELVEMLPGLHAYAGLLSPKSLMRDMEEFGEKTLQNAKSASRLGLDPQFLAGIRASAKAVGSDSDSFEKAIAKILVNVGNLKAGAGDLKENLQAKEKFQLWGLDPGEFFQMKSPEEALLKFMERYQEIPDKFQRFAFLQAFAGRGAIEAAGFFDRGAESLEHWVHVIKEHNLHTEEQIKLAKERKLISATLGMHHEEATAKAYAGFGGNASLLYGRMMAGDIGVTEATNRFGLSMLGIPGIIANLAKGRAPTGMPSILNSLHQHKQAAEDVDGLSMEEMERQIAIGEAEKALDKINDQLEEQEKLLRYTEDGWKGFERQMLAIDEAMTKSGGTEAAMKRGNEAIERLGRFRDRKQAEEEAKELDALQKQIEARLGHIKSERFAPVALAGSAEAAAANNALFTAPSGLTLTAGVEQIVKMMQQNKFDEFTKQNIRDAAIELRKLGNKLGDLPPVD